MDSPASERLAHAMLDALGERGRERLALDLDTFGSKAIGLTRAATVDLVGHHHRGQALHAWLRTYGVTDPRRFVPRSRTPRPSPVLRPTTRERTHVIFGDAHAAPGQDLRRFVEAGEIVRREAERAPEAGLVAVQIGDWTSYDSLCTHEPASKRSAALVTEDRDAGVAALEAFHRGLGVPRRGARRDLVPIALALTLGNHDVRPDRLADELPWLRGLVVPGREHRALGWVVEGYRVPLRIDGVRYQHDLPSPGGARAIGGKYAPARLLERVRYDESIVVGHSHRLQYATEATASGRRVHAVVAGAWLDHLEDYAGEDNVSEWWTGHVVLREVVDGRIGAVEFHAR